jgi:peptidoglycan/xylan/chitin deacetylase (PgdA/CDA1 family)
VRHQMDRRTLLTLLAVGTATTLAGCSARTDGVVATGAPSGPVPRPLPAPPRALVAVRPVAAQPPTEAPTLRAEPTQPASSFGTEPPPPPPPLPGAPEILTHVPPTSLPGAIAITIDDGFNPEAVAAYVAFAQDSGVHLTFNPNGCYGAIWEPHAEALRPLIEAGQVQIGNHTFSHKDVKRLSDRKLTEELERNDEWVARTFGITTRPYFRPPFGFRNARTDELAASLGYTKILLWNGSFGDSAVLTEKVLLQQAERYLTPGTIMLGHANHTTVSHLYPQILALLKSRDLTPQTLDEVFGTSRSLGF